MPRDLAWQLVAWTVSSDRRVCRMEPSVILNVIDYAWNGFFASNLHIFVNWAKCCEFSVSVELALLHFLHKGWRDEYVKAGSCISIIEASWMPCLTCCRFMQRSDFSSRLEPVIFARQNWILVHCFVHSRLTSSKFCWSWEISSSLVKKVTYDRACSLF